MRSVKLYIISCIMERFTKIDLFSLKRLNITVGFLNLKLQFLLPTLACKLVIRNKKYNNEIS